MTNLETHYRYLGVAGAVIWAATVLIRESSLEINNAAGQFLLGVAPNFGVVFVLGWLAVAYCPLVFKDQFPLKRTPLLIAGILLILLASEIIHFLFLNAGFDPWDMAASLVASGILFFVYNKSPKV